MKHKLSVHTFLSVGLLMSSLVLLSGCGGLTDFAKKGSSCPSCPTEIGEGHADQKLKGEPLSIIQGEPVITKESFEEEWQNILATEPQAAMMLQFMPNLREEFFKDLQRQKLIRQWAKDTKKDQDPTLKKRLKKQCERLELQAYVGLMQEDLMATMDTSDDALKKYYEENREKNGVFQQPPFVVTPEGVNAQLVSFNNEKSAQEFAQKTKKLGADFAALAKAAKKEVKNLGVVSAQTRAVEPAVRYKLRDMNTGDVEVVSVNAKQFDVVKAGAKQQAKYAQFEDEKIKETLKDLIPNCKINEAFNARLEELKKQYNVDDSKAQDFFKQEAEKRKAEMQEQLKRAQEQQQQQPEQSANQQEPAGQLAVVNQPSPTA